MGDIENVSIWGLYIIIAGLPLYCVWAIIVTIYASIFNLHPRCPECSSKITQDWLGLSPKFECICGVRGVVKIRVFWVNKVEAWVSPENSEEVKSL
jgi:DNA-directed RNA polymerase subunit RPC12/RpoP